MVSHAVSPGAGHEVRSILVLDMKWVHGESFC